MNDVVTYKFEEEPVRVVLIDKEPWWIANDLARVLGYRDAPNMTRNLDDDEKGTHIVSTPGGNQEMSVVSESGMFAAILKSRRSEAKRFRKWVTREVLPSIRRTGQYSMAGHEPPPLELAVNVDAPTVTVALNLIREARRLFGTNHAREVWMQLGLPQPIADSSATIDGDPLCATIKQYLVGKDAVTRADVAREIGLDPDSFADLRRVSDLLKFCGYMMWTVRVNGHPAKRWVPRSKVEG